MTTRASLAEQLGEGLLSAVLEGEYPPGSQIPPEGELAEQAGVSRLTVREAIKALRDKGVLRVEQGRGTFVNPVGSWSPFDPVLLAARSQHGNGGIGLAAQLTETRRLVEAPTAALAARRRLPADLAAMEQALDEMRAAHDADAVEAFTDADLAFHATVLAASGNPLIAAVFEPVSTLTREVRLRTSEDREARSDAISEHQQVLEAVAACDAAGAREQMENHLAHTGEHVARWRTPPHPTAPTPRRSDGERRDEGAVAASPESPA